jgi:TRAP-type mannitol/chloroaromatic compound transport system substrate-binding protein
MTMSASRREFLTRGGLLAASATCASPALANPSPEIRWTMASAFHPSLDAIYGGAQTCAAAVADLTDQRFVIDTAPAGAIVSAVDALDAVGEGKAHCAHTILAYSWTKEPAYFFGSGAPFGMNARQHAAWLRIGGGGELIDSLLAERGLMAMPMGSTGGQMAGWFRKEMRNPADLAGMKVRVGGFAGKVLETRGATAVNLAKEKILDALADGSLDAFEWIAPYDDEKFAPSPGGPRAPISTVAPYYYYPGWWKGETQLHLVVSKEKFAALPKTYQAALRSAAALADDGVRAHYDAANPAALKRLVVGGAQLRLFPQEVLEVCYQATNDLYTQLSRQNARFKAVADSYLAFRSDEYLWWQVAEYSFDNFMIRERRARH